MHVGAQNDASTRLALTDSGPFRVSPGAPLPATLHHLQVAGIIRGVRVHQHLVHAQLVQAEGAAERQRLVHAALARATAGSEANLVGLSRCVTAPTRRG